MGVGRVRKGLSRLGLAVVAADAVAALRLLPALEAAEQCCAIIGCALAGLAFFPASRLGWSHLEIASQL